MHIFCQLFPTNHSLDTKYFAIFKVNNKILQNFPKAIEHALLTVYLQREE